MSDELQVLELTNRRGMRVSCIRLGATITSLRLPNGTDIVLGYKHYEDYHTNTPYIGCTVGRIANRIKNAEFVLDGKKYRLTVNEPPNQLHGGFVGFNKAVWELKSHASDQIEFEHVSPAGTEGYPGTLTATVRYTLTEDNEFHLSYTAHTDAPTIVSLTNHTYFNLAGKGSIKNHVLYIAANQTTDLDGRVFPVTGKQTDFREPTRIKKNMTGAYSNGFDCNYSLLGVDKTYDKDPSLKMCGTVQDPSSGNLLQVFSDQPGMQLYTSNFLDGSYIGKDGKPLDKHDGVCLETQAWPNAINIAGAENQMILRPGEVHRTKTVWVLQPNKKG